MSKEKKSHEPAAIWSTQKIVFDKEVPLSQNIILCQGREALKACVNRILDLDQHIRTSPLLNAGIDTNIHPLISDLCFQAGVASTILFNNSKKGKKESDVAYNLRIDRFTYVEKLCKAQNLDPKTLKDKSVRNSLAHLDEHLGEHLTKEPNRGWFIDSAVDPTGFECSDEKIEIRFCRCYDIKKKLILHLNHQLCAQTLLNECVAVLAVVFGVDESFTRKKEYKSNKD